MAKVTITTDECEVVAVIDINDYDLRRPIAKSFFQGELYEAIERTQDMEKANAKAQSTNGSRKKKD